MNDEKLEKLLQNLLLLENNLGIALISVGQFHGCDEDDINRLIVSREKLRNIIISEFADLRRQRDGLAKILEATASCSPCLRPACHIDNPLCGQMLARAALASIKGDE